MANFELDPEFFLPPGHNIIDGGPDRLPRTYTTPAVPITRRHEHFIIADVHPAPPADHVVQVRQEVAALLLHRGLHVRSAQPWIEGVGLFELRDAADSYAAVHMVLQEVAHNSVVRFLRHDQGVGFPGQEGFRHGCLMLLGVPLDFRNTEDLRAAVNTFGEFHHWGCDDPYLVSWSAPVYILGAAATEILPNDEDPMPLNGNPHPLPGHLVNDNLQFALPPYPALGWTAVPLAPEDPVVPAAAAAADDGGWGQPSAAADGGGWEPEAAPEARVADPVQDQESMGPDAEPEEDVLGMEEAHDDNPLAIVLYKPPHIQSDNLFVGAASVFYGPPLPPVLSWSCTSDALMGAATSMHVPRQLQMPILAPIVSPKRSSAAAFDPAAPALPPLEPASSTLSVQEVIPVSPSSSVEDFSFHSPAPTKKGTRKKATPVVDSSVRRCTRGSIKRDGFKPILQELPAHVPKKRKPKAKPMPSPSQESDDVQVPPATPIPVIQEVGQSLGIAPEKLTVDRLMEDPADSAPSSADV
uniref:DUF7597 domain-containing protein n=1 Tax=Hordeum vulgare subsp. vulgare TaxID=112509 RepID=A0A8I6X9V1_HORVV